MKDEIKGLANLRKFLSHFSFSLFGQKLYIRADADKKYGEGNKRRLYIQVFYTAPCTKTKKVDEWRGAKVYLSDHMIEDEIAKRAYRAVKDAVEHEVMEGFKFDGTIVFNPHVNFRKLIEVSPMEVNRAITEPFDF